MENDDIIRVTRTMEADEEVLNVNILNHYEGMTEWTRAVVAVAKCIAKVFEKKPVEEEVLEYKASMLLRQSTMTIPADPFAAEALGANEGSRHPGEIAVPNDAWKSDKAREAISVWIIPVVSYDPDAPSSLPYLCGETDAIPLDQFGDLLAQIAIRHATVSAGMDEHKRLTTIAQIQKDFMNRFDYGMTKQ